MKDRAILQFGIESFNLTNHSNTERVSQFYAASTSLLPNYRQTLESGVNQLADGAKPLRAAFVAGCRAIRRSAPL